MSGTLGSRQDEAELQPTLWQNRCVCVCDAMTNVFVSDNGAFRTAVTLTWLTKIHLKPGFI